MTRRYWLAAAKFPSVINLVHSWPKLYDSAVILASQKQQHSKLLTKKTFKMKYILIIFVPSWVLKLFCIVETWSDLSCLLVLLESWEKYWSIRYQVRGLGAVWTDKYNYSWSGPVITDISRWPPHCDLLSSSAPPTTSDQAWQEENLPLSHADSKRGNDNSFTTRTQRKK